MVTSRDNCHFVPLGISEKCVGENLALLKSLGFCNQCHQKLNITTAMYDNYIQLTPGFLSGQPKISGNTLFFYSFASGCNIPY